MTLHSLVSHASFDWTCRGNKADLLKNLVVVLQLIGISEVDSSVSSPLFKAATKIYNLAKKPKNVRKGLECFLNAEATVLKNHLLDIIGEVEEKGEDQESDGQKEVGETKLVNGKRRKQTSANFVARVSMENIHRNALTCCSWAVDHVLHHEVTVNQVIFYYQVSDINYLK